MVQTFEFTGEKPPTLNIEELTASVAAVAPNVVVSFVDGKNWERWPYAPNSNLPAPAGLTPPADLSAPYSEPDRLTFENVPDGITEQQVRDFILNHAPAQSSEEAAAQNRADRAIDLLLSGSDSKLLELKNKLLSL